MVYWDSSVWCLASFRFRKLWIVDNPDSMSECSPLTYYTIQTTSVWHIITGSRLLQLNRYFTLLILSISEWWKKNTYFQFWKAFSIFSFVCLSDCLYYDYGQTPWPVDEICCVIFHIPRLSDVCVSSILNFYPLQCMIIEVPPFISVYKWLLQSQCVA